MTVIRHSPQQALSTKTFLPMVCVPLTNFYLPRGAERLALP